MKIFYSIKRRIKRFFYNFYNIAKWTKVLWNEQDWDYGYLLNIIQYKLKKMEKYFSTANICTPETYDEILDSLRICIKDIDHLISEDYMIECFKDVPEHEYGKPFSEEAKKIFLEANNVYLQKDKELNDEFFNTMRDNYQKWWD